MQLHIHIYNHDHREKEILNKLNLIIMEQKDFALQLTALKDQLTKAQTEITDKLKALGDAIDAADDVAPEVQTAFDELKAAVQGVDDIVADQPTEPPTI